GRPDAVKRPHRIRRTARSSEVRRTRRSSVRVSASAALVAGFARDRAVRSAFLLGDPALVGLAAVRASGRARAALLARVLPGERLAGAGDVLADAQRGLRFGVGVA